MKLSNTQCAKAKPTERPYKLTDGNGLYLEVMPTGKKYWRWQYRFAGKRPRLPFGPYPEVSLAEARDRRDVNRKLLRDNVDPGQHHRHLKRRSMVNASNTLELVAREWHALQAESWTEAYAKYVIGRLEHDIFPEIGSIPIRDLRAMDVLAAVRRIEKRGANELAHRNLQNIGRICRYAILTERADIDPTHKLSEALTPKSSTHYKAFEIEELPKFVTALRRNTARLYPTTICATELIMLTFVRTGELIGAKWSEFDLENRQWLIPASRMKMSRDHIVPLSRQALTILEQLQTLSVNSQYVFPHFSKADRHMSNNTILKAIERLGYKGRMTGHGFRSLAMSAIKEKLDYRHEVIDRQLAHQPGNKVDKAYDRAQFLDERKVMMQEWADYIDERVRKYQEHA